jgi:predicted enzyme related to lactoylglutathione lyase
MIKNGYTHGRVVWRELVTQDAARARAFYGAVFGWTFEELSVEGGVPYTLIFMGGKRIAGLFQPAASTPGPSQWLSYVSVPDVDAVAKAAVSQGGKVVRGPGDIPGIGRFVLLRDFAGAHFVAYRDAQGDPAVEPPKPGEFYWETLGTPNATRAKTFYGKLFGWTALKGRGGSTPVFTTDDTMKGQVADIQETKEFTPSWMPQLVVEKLVPTCDRVSELGGEVPAPLIAVPGVGRVAVVEDPMGAPLALFEASRK